MSHMDSFKNQFETRQSALTGLAIAGFIALIALGIWLAVYSTRFVPPVVSRISSAAVYLGQVFTPHRASLLVVETATSTSPVSGEITTPTATSSRPVSVPQKSAPQTKKGETVSKYPVSPAGLPDLLVTVNRVGYLATSSASSFVESSTVPTGSRPAVRFSITNVGGSATGAWRWSASIPTVTAYIYKSQDQQSLAPGDSIDYTLGFDQALRGASKTIVITANSDHAFAESTLSNNTATTTLTILGS